MQQRRVNGGIHPFVNIDPTGEHAFEAGWTSPTQPEYSVWWWLRAPGPGTSTGSGGPGAETCQRWDTGSSPPPSLTQAMFANLSATVPNSDLVGVGLYAPWFWQRTFRGACFRTDHSKCHPLPDRQAPAAAWAAGAG